MTRAVVLALAIALLALASLGSTAVGARPKARCNGLVANRVGTDRAQVIRGTRGDDVIVAKGGADRIFAGEGNDVICAGGGNDIIDGGRGKDLILGGFGNDTLKGGPGKDVLDGGAGRDGCYPAAGNDTLRRCEDADLAVAISAPASVHDGEPIEYTVRVSNTGAKRSGAYDLNIAQVPTNAVCSLDHSGTTSSEPVWPGAWSETSYEITNGCVAQPGSDWHVAITATVQSADPDADAANDQATARIDILPPQAQPKP